MQQKVSVRITGMTCQSCASRIEKTLNKKDFIQQADVNFATEEAQIIFDNALSSTSDILDIIHKTGFEGALKSSDNQQINVANEKINLRLWALLIINIPFMIGMLGMMFGDHRFILPPIWLFILATIVQFGLALPFYRSAISSIRGGLANMDVLVSTGTLTIYLYSTFMLFYHRELGHDDAPHIYFEAAVMVIGFVSLGKFLEARTKKQSLNSIGLLTRLIPQQVNVRQQDGQWQCIDLNQVKINDVLRANQGERIAADGIVEQGQGWCDESHLTGESIPAVKTTGSPILAGAMVTDGSLIYRVQRLDNQTLLGDMINALSEAQGSKAPIARFADKMAAIFVPTVLLISLITFLLTLWHQNDLTTALIHAVAVLVIACPCALGLATPAAIMVGMGKAANLGIWFKDAASMEEAARVDTVVLDKTGTLTTGSPQIVATWRPENSIYSELDLYRFAAAVEQHANHPLAKAIVQATLSKTTDIPTALLLKTEVGAGLQAEIEGVGIIKVGKPDYCNLILPPQNQDVWFVSSIVAVALDDQPIGAFALADQLREDARQAIQRLFSHSIDVFIMSGDNQSVVDYVAKQLGIKQAFGQLTPREKAEHIQQLQREGKIVAMVGDGINDTPALAVANVGFAMQDGTDIAAHTASATLMQHSINQLVNALLVSQATLKNIKQNLFFALIYNVLGIPLAALGYLSPIIAGAAMAMSSISVLMNALRLKRQKLGS